MRYFYDIDCLDRSVGVQIILFGAIKGNYLEGDLIFISMNLIAL